MNSFPSKGDSFPRASIWARPPNFLTPQISRDFYLILAIERRANVEVALRAYVPLERLEMVENEQVFVRVKLCFTE